MKPYLLPLILFTATLVLGGIPFGMNPMGAGGQLACGLATTNAFEYLTFDITE